MKPFLLEGAIDSKDTRNYKNLDFKYNAMKYLDTEVAFPAKRTILIFTRKEDGDIDVLGPELIKEEINYIRVDSNDLRDFSFCVNVTNNEVEIVFKSGKESYNLNDIPVIIYRHFDVDSISYLKDPVSEKFIQNEWREVLNVFEDFYTGLWINSPSATVKNRKSYQLFLSKKVGFETLDSWVTNNPKMLNKENEIYTKSLDTHFVEIPPNKRVRVYGKKVHPWKWENEVLTTPSIYQTAIDHNCEARVIIFDDQCWGVKYISGNEIDVHKKNMDTLFPKEIKVPDDIKEKGQKLMSTLKLRFAALDFILIESKWIFLEINATGDWCWLETRTNLNITTKYVEYIKKIIDNSNKGGK